MIESTPLPILFSAADDGDADASADTSGVVADDAETAALTPKQRKKLLKQQKAVALKATAVEAEPEEEGRDIPLLGSYLIGDLGRTIL